LQEQKKGGAKKKEKPAAAPVVLANETSLDIRRVLDTLPHRYPFVMIDRVVEFADSGDELTALKNVTINEPYFQGHYPGNPVMPGVLQIEAMAQAAGVLMLRKIGVETKAALFMSCDKVKFRKAVRPGDQLVIKVKLTKARGNKIGVATGECTVNGQVVSSAELMFAVMDHADIE
ncbi:MAG TPA: 3-hydroxyacyl-ACP dehydratase FabZ, partial [Opitutus sp.]|nr:3-hydroxyacyl-ACP dehydratase FabZ [Opitutus sp.]